MIFATIKGGKELDKLLQRLPVEVETKILRNGLAAGAAVIRDEARALAPIKSGRLRRAIKTSRNTNKNEGMVIAKVKLDRRYAFIGRFIEYGVAAHQIFVRDGKKGLVIDGVNVGKQVWHPGHAPRPFLRPALDARAGDAVKAVAEYLASYLKFGAITAPVVAIDLEEAA